jgi:hypothetical protein
MIKMGLDRKCESSQDGMLVLLVHTENLLAGDQPDDVVCLMLPSMGDCGGLKKHPFYADNKKILGHSISDQKTARVHLTIRPEEQGRESLDIFSSLEAPKWAVTRQQLVPTLRHMAAITRLSSAKRPEVFTLPGGAEFPIRKLKRHAIQDFKSAAITDTPEAELDSAFADLVLKTVDRRAGVCPFPVGGETQIDFALQWMDAIRFVQTKVSKQRKSNGTISMAMTNNRPYGKTAAIDIFLLQFRARDSKKTYLLPKALLSAMLYERDEWDALEHRGQRPSLGLVEDPQAWSEFRLEGLEDRDVEKFQRSMDRVMQALDALPEDQRPLNRANANSVSLSVRGPFIRQCQVVANYVGHEIEQHGAFRFAFGSFVTDVVAVSVAVTVARVEANDDDGKTVDN